MREIPEYRVIDESNSHRGVLIQTIHSESKFVYESLEKCSPLLKGGS
jgi:hypothetical protein